MGWARSTTGPYSGGWSYTPDPDMSQMMLNPNVRYQTDAQLKQAQLAAQAQQSIAQQQAGANRYGSLQSRLGSQNVAKTQGDTQLGVANTNRQSAYDTTKLQSDASTQNVNTQTLAQRDIASLVDAGNRYQADQGLAGQLGVAGLNKDAQLGTARIGADASTANANIGANASMFNATTGADAARYQSDQARIASMFPAQQQMERFNQVFPWLQGQVGNFMSGSTSGGGGGAGGGGGGGVNAGPIWSDQQIQQQVNARRAGNDQAMQAQNRGSAQNLAGRGFGANSPLLAAMQQSAANQNLGQNATDEREIRWGAAEGNAAHQLRAAQVAEQQRANMAQEGLEGKKINQSTINVLLGSLAGLI